MNLVKKFFAEGIKHLGYTTLFYLLGVDAVLAGLCAGAVRILQLWFGVAALPPHFYLVLGILIFCAILLSVILAFVAAGFVAKHELQLAPMPLQSRLKVLSAHYGVEGGRDEDVTDKLQRKAHDALALWVENSEFGPDPVQGVTKRLKVSYSFDNRPARTVEREEHDLIVLPEEVIYRQKR